MRRAYDIEYVAEAAIAHNRDLIPALKPFGLHEMREGARYENREGTAPEKLWQDRAIIGGHRFHIGGVIDEVHHEELAAIIKARPFFKCRAKGRISFMPRP